MDDLLDTDALTEELPASAEEFVSGATPVKLPEKGFLRTAAEKYVMSMRRRIRAFMSFIRKTEVCQLPAIPELNGRLCIALLNGSHLLTAMTGSIADIWRFSMELLAGMEPLYLLDEH